MKIFITGIAGFLGSRLAQHLLLQGHEISGCDTIPFNKLSDTFHFDGEMLMMGGKKHLRIADLPIPTHYGDEKSHLRPIQYGLDVLGIIFKNFMGRYNF